MRARKLAEPGEGSETKRAIRDDFFLSLADELHTNNLLLDIPS